MGCRSFGRGNDDPVVSNDIWNEIERITWDPRDWAQRAHERFSDVFRGSPFGFGGLSWSGRDKLVAYPVPSAHQYTQCLDQGGKSTWNSRGIWRCLLRDSSNVVEGPQFGDYTGFLEYQRQILREREAELESRLNRRLPEVSKKVTEAAKSKLPDFSANDAMIPGSDRPRLIDESEARGKNVISENMTSETVTLDDGSLETRTQIVKYFDDHTAMVKRTSENKGKPKGWFWN